MREVLTSVFTTFGIGGKARLVTLEKPDDFLNLTNEVILGGGSNVLIGRKNLPVFALNRAAKTEFCGEEVYCLSGERTAKLCLLAAAKSLSGLEWAAGLPGTVGGAIKGNAGAAGKSFSDCISFVDVVRHGKKVRLTKDECGFSYRSSGLAPDDYIVGAGLVLGFSTFPEIQKNLSAAREKRLGQPKGRSAGCVFKNPKGGSAGKIIDEGGLKGLSEGGARVSREHANFIVSDGTASFHDVMSLIERIEKEVLLRRGINLSREIKIYGDE